MLVLCTIVTEGDVSMQGNSTPLYLKPLWAPSIFQIQVLQLGNYPLQEYYWRSGMPKTSPTLRTWNQVSTCELGLVALLHNVQCSSYLLRHSPSNRILYETIMQGVHHLGDLQCPREEHWASEHLRCVIHWSSYHMCAYPSQTISHATIHLRPSMG